MEEIDEEIKERTRRTGFTFEILEELFEEDVEIVAMHIDMPHRILEFYVYHEDFPRRITPEGQELVAVQPLTSTDSECALRKFSFTELE